MQAMHAASLRALSTIVYPLLIVYQSVRTISIQHGSMLITTMFLVRTIRILP